MMDAQDRHALHAQVENLLLAMGPLLRKRPALFRQASAVFASVVSNTPLGPDACSVEVFSAGIDRHHGAAPAPIPLPAFAVGHFPFSRPTPHLRDQQAQIEAMLAPMSDRRARAHHMSRLLKPLATPHHETRME